MEGKLQSLGGEHSNRFVEGKMESNLHRGLAPLPCTLQTKTLLCWCGWGLPAEAQVLEVTPRERTGVGYVETAGRGWAIATEGVFIRSLGLPERQGAIIKRCMKRGTGPP